MRTHKDIELGRKLPREYENPFDNFFIDIASSLNTLVFRPLNYTPNMITTMSLFLAVTSVVLFYKQWYIIAALFFTTAYILDCADGNFARTYNMETKFGDYYDHISDILKFILIAVAFAFHQVPQVFKVTSFIIIIILYFLSMVHLGCQEAIYNPDDSNTAKQDSLSHLKPLCGGKKEVSINKIKYTRYVGCGTTVVAIALVIIITKFVRT